MSLNIHVYPSSIENESRILRITKSLSDHGIFDEFLIVGILGDGTAATEMIDSRRRILRLPQRSFGNRRGFPVKLMKAVEWNARVVGALGRKKAACVNCHSLAVLPVCVLLKYLCRAKLVYDTHELETESAGSRGARKVLSKILERSLMRFVDVTVVVSGSISDWYRNAYRLESVPVVMNLPEARPALLPGKDNYLRRRFGIDGKAFLFVYLGILAPGRGIDILLDSFSRTKTDSHIVFMGFGVLSDKVRDYEKRFSNIHFHPAVDPGGIGRHLSGADVGVSLIENTCLSYYYCLPNKLFEYLSNGLPVLSSDFPEMEKIVRENECGWSIPANADSLRSCLDAFTREEIERKKAKALECGNRFDWSVEEKKLVEIYAGLFPSGQEAAPGNRLR